ncbi:C40 family peptidase [Prescottella subtropica]|uniref:C40 family peptidase n=1 Tax=Prescottella subtropica TaxID=2545757 RepID=UPI0010F7AFC8|nr:C40 family peptidase [Prescottella subtropica]
MIDVLARPVAELLGAFGTGMLPAGSPSDALRVASDTLDAAYAIGRTAIGELDRAWSGIAADAAVGKVQATQASTVVLSDQGREIATVVDTASETVRTGTVELQAILDSFLAQAASALPLLATPGGPTVLIASALDHLQRALTVVERVRGELAGHTAALAELTAPDPVPAPPRIVDTAFTPASFDTGSLGSGSLGTGSLDTGSAGSVEILLPDGSTAVAPNREAADAVRNALTQQGVPYQWGGTSPGQGLDCSGLTQWAYGEAGVDLPRLAQEQSVGTPVNQADLMPGDLAVWDGHVAMVIGGGQMIEAGDPVAVSAIRTDNIGMGFHGFYRPTTT